MKITGQTRLNAGPSATDRSLFKAAEAVKTPWLWDKEYSEIQVIPSTSRTDPSKSLLLLEALLDLNPGLRVLDAGSGPGRNAVYLAAKGCRVWAVDSSREAVQRLVSRSASLSGTERGRVFPIEAALTAAFPFFAGSFDVVLDTYFFCHALTDESKEHLKEEFHRVMKSGGFLLSTVFTTEDEYYRGLLDLGNGTGQVVTDPANGISKYLYQEAEVKEFFSSHFVSKYFIKFEFADFVLSRPFKRSTYVQLLTR